MAGKTRNGRPPKYTSPEAMQEVVDRYFEECDGKLLTDEGGNPVLSRSGTPVIEGKKLPTIFGLALVLGFRSRQSLLNYQAKRDFQDIISDAKLRVEEYTEERLFDKKGRRGAVFILQHCFKGWNAQAAKQESAPAGVQIVCDIPKMGICSSGL